MKNKGYQKYPANSISKKKKPPRQAPMQRPPYVHSTAPSAAPSTKYHSVQRKPITHTGGSRWRIPICAIPSLGEPHQRRTPIPKNASRPPAIKAQVSVLVLSFFIISPRTRYAKRLGNIPNVIKLRKTHCRHESGTDARRKAVPSGEGGLP